MKITKSTTATIELDPDDLDTLKNVCHLASRVIDHTWLEEVPKEVDREKIKSFIKTIFNI